MEYIIFIIIIKASYGCGYIYFYPINQWFSIKKHIEILL